MRKIFCMNYSSNKKNETMKEFSFEFRPHISHSVDFEFNLFSYKYHFNLNINLFDLIYLDVCRTTKEVDHAGWYYSLNILGLFVGGQYCSTKHADDSEID